MIAPRPAACFGGPPTGCATGTIGALGSVGDCCESPDVGSGPLDKGGFPLTNGPRGSDDGSAGASPSFFEETAGFSGRLADPAELSETMTGNSVGPFLPGSPVRAGAGAGFWGGDAGWAASADGVAFSATVVGSASV